MGRVRTPQLSTKILKCVAHESMIPDSTGLVENGAWFCECKSILSNYCSTLYHVWETRINVNLKWLLVFSEVRLELASECFLALLQRGDLGGKSITTNVTKNCENAIGSQF